MNGERHGKGRQYDDINGKLIYEGEYLGGEREGKGKQYFQGRLEYEGEFKNNKKWNGKGYDENNNIIYELINGTGKVKEYSNVNGKLEFEGEYLNGKKHGKGKEYDNGE